MGADEKAANKMTKNIIDLANTLRQNETANGATDGAANNSGLKKSDKWYG